MKKRIKSTLRSVGLTAGLCALMIGATACGGSDSGADGNKITITADPSAIAAFVAQERGMFEGVDVEVTTAGYDQAGSLLISGDTQIAWMGPLEAAQYASEGEDFQYMSTAGALNMFNGVVVRKEDADKYKSVADLKGKKLGIPGFGTGTWADFAVFASMFYDVDDAKGAFNTVTADSGALLALLEKGEIDAALLFAAESASSRYSDKFSTVFSFTEVMQKELGQPLAITGGVASAKWLKENPDDAQAVIDGLDKAVKWMQENPQEFDTDGKYAKLAEGDGWHTSKAATEGILKLVSEGKWFLTSDVYTKEWQDAVYKVVQEGEGSLVESVPPLEDFLAPVQ